MSITLITGDITAFGGDAVVNAANNLGLGGGGVDGAIHRAAGPRLLEACKALPLLNRPGMGRNREPVSHIRVPNGGCVPTPAFDMPAKWILHTAGPVWPEDMDREMFLPDNSSLSGMQMKLGVTKTTAGAEARATLRNCYKMPMLTAMGMGLKSIAYPAISTGVYGCPVETCAEVVLQWAHDYRDWPLDVFIYLYPASHLDQWVAVGKRLRVPLTVREP